MPLQSKFSKEKIYIWKVNISHHMFLELATWELLEETWRLTKLCFSPTSYQTFNKIMTDTQEVAKTVLRAPVYPSSISFPPVLTSYTTIGQFQNQKVDMGIICTYSSSTCAISPCVDSCRHHCNQTCYPCGITPAPHQPLAPKILLICFPSP